MDSLITLHIVPDDKFANMVHRDFERFGKNNRYICFDNSGCLKYINGWKPDRITKDKLNKYIEVNNVSIIVFHSLLDKYIIKSLSCHLVVVWCGWGYDYYSYLLSKYYPQGMILEHTKSIFDNTRKQKKITLMEFLKGGYRVARRKLLNKIYPPQKIVAHIDFFIPVIDTEFKLVKKLNPWFSSEYISWNYGTLEEDYTVDNYIAADAGNILVGNSATPENNHIEAFEFIRLNIDWKSHKIYCPLSYGDLEYAQRIKNIGIEFFGDNFIPLMNFLDKVEYNKILSSCRIMVFNHVRQQALGNIISGLAMEKVILLNKINPLCEWLDENKISYLTLDNKRDNIDLAAIDIVRNKKQIMRVWSKNVIAEKTMKMIEITHDAARQKKHGE